VGHRVAGHQFEGRIEVSDHSEIRLDRTFLTRGYESLVPGSREALALDSVAVACEQRVHDREALRRPERPLLVDPERPDRGLVERVVMEGEHVDAGVLGTTGGSLVLLGARFVRTPIPSSRAT
jgi:hypothetical protein